MIVRSWAACKEAAGSLQACQEVARVSPEHLEVDNIDMPETRTVMGEAAPVVGVVTMCVWGGSGRRKGKEKGGGVSKLAPKLSSRDGLQHHDSICNTARRLRTSSEALLEKPMILLKPMIEYHREPGVVVESVRRGFRRATAATQQGRGTNSRQDSHDNKGTDHETSAGAAETLSLQLQG